MSACDATTEAPTFGDQLFEASMPFANQSLYGNFMNQMVAGTLPNSTFQKYLYQDNLYLSKYARAFAVMGARAERTDELAWLLNQSVNYLHEHGPGANVALEEEVFERDALPVTVAYTSFFLQAVWGEDTILGYASVLPCQRLYDWLFSTINSTRHIAPDNPYKAFIEQYADPRNHHTTKILESYLERYVAQGITRQQAERAQYHYNTAMKYEAQFFQQAFSTDALFQQRSLSEKKSAGTRYEGPSDAAGEQPFASNTHGESLLSWPSALWLTLGVAIASSMATALGRCLAGQLKLPGAARQSAFRGSFALLDTDARSDSTRVA